MSIHVMDAVWKGAPYEGGALLVLLALADHADEDGVCWPSIDAIAKKARLGPRQVRKILKQFRQDGTISIESGGGRGLTNRYRVNVKTLNSKTLNPKTLFCETQTLSASSRNPVFCDIAIRKNRHEPSKEPSERENKRFTQLPANFQPKESHHTLAAKLGVDLEAAFQIFTEHYLAKGSTFKDWDRALNIWLKREKSYSRNGAIHGNTKSPGNRAQQRQASNLAANEEAKRSFGLAD